MTRKCNYPLLHQNSIIFWLMQDLTSLATEGRPLSQQHSLSDLYDVRRPLYEAFSDYQIDNNRTCADTVNAIISCLEGTQ